MITKIRKFQDSWLVKGILALTALSFMSLFGISGYIGHGKNNRAIVRVDDVEIMQDDINNQLNEQIQTTRNLFGDDMEISETMRTAMLYEIVQKNLVNAILQKTAQDNNVSISDELVRKIIYSQPEFMDASGQFSLEKMRRMLSLTGWSEQKYIETLRRDVIKQHLVQSPVEGITLPKAINPYLSELDGQRKIFQFAVIDPAKLKVDRKISAEEIEQNLRQSGLNYAMMSKKPAACDILCADQMGFLQSLYTCAAITFVGGSIAPKGAHNLLEPAIVGKVVLFGKSYHNTPDTAHALLTRGGGILVDETNLKETVLRLLGDKTQLLDMSEKARKTALGFKGATDKIMKVVEDYERKSA